MSDINQEINEPVECLCDTSIYYNQSENFLFNHIKKCKEYQKKSGLFKQFKNFGIQDLEVSFLVTIKNELLGYVEQIQDTLKQKGYNREIWGKIQNQNDQSQIKDHQLQEKTNQIQKQPQKQKQQQKMEIKKEQIIIKDDSDTEFIDSDLVSSEIDQNPIKNLKRNNNLNKKSNQLDIKPQKKIKISQQLDEEDIQEQQQQNQEDSGDIKCQNCKKCINDFSQVLFLENCSHIFCVMCLEKYILDVFIEKKCEIPCLLKDCKLLINNNEIQHIIGKQRYEKLEYQLINSEFDLVKCVKCEQNFEFQQGQINQNIKDQEGNLLDKQHELNYAQNRFICKNLACKTEQCKNCKAVPYHLGKTCEELKKHQNSKRCRYCDETIKKNSREDYKQALITYQNQVAKEKAKKTENVDFLRDLLQNLSNRDLDKEEEEQYKKQLEQQEKELQKQQQQQNQGLFQNFQQKKQQKKGLTVAKKQLKDLKKNKKMKKVDLIKELEDLLYQKNINLHEFDDVCFENECLEKAQYACSKIHEDCGHPCLGVKNEKKCEPCLYEECAKKQNLDINEHEYCSICYTEGLKAAPVLKSKCGHVFHYHCIKKRLEVKWTTARIVFRFMDCPNCNKLLEFPAENKMQKILVEQKGFKDVVIDKALKRLKNEDREKDKKLITEGSGFYKDPVNYSLAIYSYYQCYECKLPYFGGLKDCERQLDEGNKEFKEEELICPGCCSTDVLDCKKHGKDYIDFKCRYCCGIALFFCHGNTHYCEPCHNHAWDFMQNKAKIPVCKGKATCPLKVDHAPNGEEQALGCSLCRNLMDENKDD